VAVVNELRIVESRDYPFPGRMFHVFKRIPDPKRIGWEFIGGVQQRGSGVLSATWSWSRDGINWIGFAEDKELAARYLTGETRLTPEEMDAQQPEDFQRDLDLATKFQKVDPENLPRDW
jgi:hypothetical protein